MEDSMDSSGAAARRSVEQEQTSTFMLGFLEQHCRGGNRIRGHRVDRRETLLVSQIHGIYIRQSVVQINRFVWLAIHKNCPSGSKLSKHKLTSIRASSGQFKVLRDGCWSRIDFRRDEPKVDQEEESEVPLTNPWIQRYGTSQTEEIRNRPATCAEAPSATTGTQHAANNFHLWRQSSLGGNTEVTDQNFNDEALEEEKSGKIRDMEKRTKDQISGNDQVVPFCNIVQVNDGGGDHVNVLPKD
ncbi:hypothetical protein Sango_2971000 [Sesamum angolense]|uniref:Uncharacterized protein n=1 Tax=Sesamum angolense TaxID=2727404 RepID=A0AAE1T2T6_9LAMI|nr:hypothetical protein Sango_2971000 [Sesamum angolense]